MTKPSRTGVDIAGTKAFAVAIVVAAGLLGGCAGGQSPPASPSAQPDRPTRDLPGARANQSVNAARPAAPPAIPTIGSFETVATCDGPMWTGVTVSKSGRVFVNFPRWGDNVEFTVAEVKNGKPVAYPDAEINHFDPNHLSDHLISAQSVVVGPDDRLYVLDTGTARMRSLGPHAAKLVAIDLNTNQVVKMIVLPPDVALETTYLNDVRFNMRQGTGGIAYVTDSGDQGPNGIIVIDLDSQKSWRKLTGHPSVRAEKGFVATLEGKPLMTWPSSGSPKPVTVGSDGIAISADGRTLFYCPMSGHHLYGVSTAALADPALSDDEVAQSVVDYGDRGYASDGLESDAAGRLYLTDYEHNAVHRRTFGPGGPGDVKDEVLVQGPNLVWPDTLSLAADGYLYFTVNQLNRQKQFNDGVDLRRKPYLLLRTKY